MKFHEISGATHGCDDIRSYTFICCTGRSVRVEPDPDTVEKTRAIIEKVIKAGWNLQHGN